MYSAVHDSGTVEFLDDYNKMEFWNDADKTEIDFAHYRQRKLAITER